VGLYIPSRRLCGSQSLTGNNISFNNNRLHRVCFISAFGFLLVDHIDKNIGSCLLQKAFLVTVQGAFIWAVNKGSNITSKIGEGEKRIDISLFCNYTVILQTVTDD
jgi:hypothetical protein